VYEGPQLAGKAGRRWGSKQHAKPIKPKGWSPWTAA